MKRTFIAFCFLCVVSMSLLSKTELKDDVYRRNSLCTYFINDHIYCLVSQNQIIDSIADFLSSYMVSDKFDDHTIGDRFLTINNIPITDQDILFVNPTPAKKKSKFASFMEKVGDVSNSALSMMDSGYKQELEKQKAYQETDEIMSFLKSHPEIVSAATEEQYKDNTIKTAARLYRYIIDNKLHNKLLAKWFNAKNNKENGSHYDMAVIRERGLYNASELDVMRAAESVRKWAILEDAGMDLISHTFISFTEFEVIDYKSYLEREKQIKEWDKKISEAKYGKKTSSSSLLGSKADKQLGKLGEMANKTLFDGKFKETMQEAEQDRVDEATGFYITSTTYLFQLDWDKESEENFIQNYWESDLSKLLNSDEFGIKYIGYERNTINTTQGTYSFGQGLKHAVVDGFKSALFGEKAAKEERSAMTEKDRAEKNLLLTKQSLVRSIDKTYADLQKSHEDFKVKSPLIDVEKDKITAFIGMKEGVNSKSKFEVLERSFNEKKGIIQYKKVATLSVDKDRIWDNRYTLVDDKANVRGKGKNAETIDRTYLKGKIDKIAPGMLIRQIK